jgi:uncharacterized phage protein (TIGR01671 family)
MNREILFKAKRLDNGEWVEGFYQVRKDVFENDEHLIFRGESYHTWEYAKIDPTTLCQYTGLTDKNGKKIWENDIVAHSYTAWTDVLESPLKFKTVHKKKNYVIKWDCTVSHMGYRYHNGRNIFPFKLGTVINGDDEVIGNIFDNPELLRGEDDENG